MLIPIVIELTEKDHNAKQTATLGIPQKSRKISKAARGNARRAQECVRVLRVVQRLLSRDMRQQKLSLRKAARDGHIAIGSLSSVLDTRRVADPPSNQNEAFTAVRF